MEIPKWSGESYRFARYRIRVFWFRLLFASALVAAGFGLSKALQTVEFGDARETSRLHVHRYSKSGDHHPKPQLIPVGSVEIVGIPPVKTNAADQELLATLMDKTSGFRLAGAPFSDFLELFREKSGQNVLVSTEARELIENESFEISLDASNISLMSALKLATLGRGLQYRIQGGVIRIESAEERSEPLILHSYDVSELLYLVAKQRHDGSDSCASAPACCGMEDEEHEEGSNLDNADSLCSCGMLSGDILIEFIEKACVDEDDEGSLELTQGLLFVRKSASTHRKIEHMLRALVAGMRTTSFGAEASSVPESNPLSIFEIECERRFAKLINVNFQDTPLSDVLSYVSDISGVHIFVNPNIDREEILVNIKVSKISINQMLNFVARDHQLAMYRAHESLILTNQECHSEYNEYLVDLQPVSDLFESKVEAEMLDAEYLTEILRNSTGEDNWEDPAAIEVIFGQLFVRQTAPVHKAIRKTLKALRQAKKSR
ncbi:MAG: hypothetical protein P1V97_17665 [Planctomycetota bacterium]|nr:hypothetical protein [Planctomycetota bacterium]